MDHETAKHYLWEVVRESELVERLHRQFIDAAEAWLRADHIEETDGTVTWTSIDSERTMEAALEGIIAGFARISLFFFPSGTAGPRGAARASALRALVGVDAKHPLADRQLRNHWMHLDERLDEALETRGFVPVGFYLDRAHRIPSEKRYEYFRLVDPGAEAVYVHGERFDLRRIADAVQHVGNLAALVIVGRPDDNVAV